MSAVLNPRLSYPIIGSSFALLAGLFVLTSRAEPPTASAPQPQQIQRFAKLEKGLTGIALVGHSTTTGGDETKLEPERYELKSVKHVGEDQWLFTARIRYGDHDVTLPLTLPIHWAGDTPVITVDNMGIPGLGTYTARVMIYADHYAGFWSGGDHGGHLFGVIEKPLTNKPETE
jgi:hypothetical protein